MNTPARSLRIGILINTLDDYFQRAVVEGLRRKAVQEGVQLLFIAGHRINTPLPFEQQFNIVYALGDCLHIDAIVCGTAYLQGSVTQEETIAFINRYRHLPLVSLSFEMPGRASLLIDNEAGLRPLLYHLTQDHGYRRLAFMQGPKGNRDAEERYAVYRSVLEERGLPFDPRLVVSGNFNQIDGSKAMQDLLDRNVPFDALVVANDSMAQGAMLKAVERGLRIPQDFAITGFDDIRSLTNEGHSLTTVNQSIYGQAELALETLLRQLRGDAVPLITKLPTHLVIRQSCGCLGRIFGAETSHRAMTPPPDAHEAILQTLGLSPEMLADYRSYLRQVADALVTDHSTFEETLGQLAQRCLQAYGDIFPMQAMLVALYRHVGSQAGMDLQSLQNCGERLLRGQIILSNAQSVFHVHEMVMEDTSFVPFSERGFLKRRMPDFDHTRMMDLIEEAMHEFSIASAYIALYPEPVQFESLEQLTLPQEARLVFAMKNSVRNHAVLNQPVPLQQLVPGALFGDTGFEALALFPIFQHTEHYGYLLLDVANLPRCQLETIREEISSSIIAGIWVAELDTKVQLEAAMDKLQRSQEELARSETKAALATMIASVSHELNTPLSNGLMMASTLVDQSEEFQRLLEGNQVKRSDLGAYVANVREGNQLLMRNLGRATDLMNNFRQVANDQASEQRRVFDLSVLLRGIVDTLSPSLKRHPHTIIMQVPEGIVMDSLPGPLGQIAINLINNAYLHAFDGRSDGVLTISATPVPGEVLLEFSDNGVGIPADNLARLFEPFFSTKKGKGGTGLGMGIVDSLVCKTLGGSIAVQSTLGRGTQFSLRLPLAAPAPFGAA